MNIWCFAVSLALYWRSSKGCHRPPAFECTCIQHTHTHNHLRLVHEPSRDRALCTMQAYTVS